MVHVYHSADFIFFTNPSCTLFKAHIAKIKIDQIETHITKSLIYGAKMLGESVETLKKDFHRCPFLQSEAN